MEKDRPDRKSVYTPVLAGVSMRGFADLDLVYRRYRDRIRKYVVHRFGGGPPDPDDVVQVVFERYAEVAAARKIVNPSAFLIRSARNYVIDQRRQQAVRADYVRDVQAVASSSDDLNAEYVLESKQRWAALKAAIDRLDERSRKMLLLNRLHGLSSAEIARREGCSPTLVKSIIARALVACHCALAEAEQG